MSFANPQYRWLLFIVPLFLVVIHFLMLRRQKAFQPWIAKEVWGSVIPEYSKKVFLLKRITFGISFFFLIFALCRPQWGEREEVIQSQGMDILFALDVSNSMLAEDVSPSRLGRAQTFIKKTMALLPSDRIGIIAFAGSAYLAAPLTTDFGYISEIVDSLGPEMITNQGTDLGQALAVALMAFERGAEDDRQTSHAIITISDGEDFGSDAIKSTKAIQDLGVGFFALSVGTTEGGPIPVRDDSGVLQTYKKDISDKPILTRVNKNLLSKIASSAGGKFIELVNVDDASSAIARELSQVGRNSKKEQRQITKIDRYTYFLCFSILFFIFHLFVGYQPVRFRVPILGVFLLQFLFPQLLYAQSLDSYLNNKKGVKEYRSEKFEESAQSFREAKKTNSDHSILNFNEATSLSKAKRGGESLPLFQSATQKSLAEGDYETAAKSLYNEGVTHLQNQNLKESYDRLTKAVEVAKISNQPELEKKAREALYSMIDKQKQKSKEDQEKKSKEDPNKKEKNQAQSEGKGQDQKPDQSSSEQNSKKGKSPELEKRSFQSGTLSKDVAESIMNDLSDREKQLYQRRMKEQKSRERRHEKDW